MSCATQKRRDHATAPETRVLRPSIQSLSAHAALSRHPAGAGKHSLHAGEAQPMGGVRAGEGSGVAPAAAAPSAACRTTSRRCRRSRCSNEALVPIRSCISVHIVHRRAVCSRAHVRARLAARAPHQRARRLRASACIEQAALRLPQKRGRGSMRSQLGARFPPLATCRPPGRVPRPASPRARGLLRARWK